MIHFAFLNFKDLGPDQLPFFFHVVVLMSFDFCELFLFLFEPNPAIFCSLRFFKQGPGFYRLCRKHMHKDSALANVEVFC